MATKSILTFLMTDVQGSTRLWEHSPHAMPEIVQRHEEIVSSVVSTNNGRLIKSKGEGDSTFSVFESPSQAVLAALSIRRALADEIWPDGIVLKVRMALHTGEASARDDDFFGPTINRCARIREVGHGGQILVSSAAYQLALGAGQVQFKDLGLHRLRDLLRPEHIWQVDDAGMSSAFPNLKSLTVLRNNLPVQLTSFIGRRPQLEHVKSLIQKNRLVNVVGFGGEGKTRLVLQVGAEAEDDDLASVWFVALESLRTEPEVVAAIASALGLPPGSEISGESIRGNVILAESTLLILDNAEHLIPIVRPIVDLLLRELPNVHILVSSREPLRLTGENVYRIPGLTLPPEPCESVEALNESEAGQLFVSRAVARTSDYRVTAASVKAVGNVCHLLNGVPLAIEQAASLVSIMSPAQIVEKLKNRLDWLATEDPSVPERHRSLAATIQWSFELLTEDERKLLLILGLFRDSISIEAIASIANPFVESDVRAFELVRGLVDKSLVVTSYEDESEVRFRLLETVRQFSQAHIGDENDRWMGRYVDWYIEFARQADAELYGSEQVQWLEKCDLESANFRKALTWCEERSDARLLELAYLLRKYWMRKGLILEGRSWIEKAYAIATVDSEPTRAVVANVLGAFASMQNDYVAAVTYYREAEAAFEAAGESRALAGIYTNIAIVLQDLGDLQGAEVSGAQAIAVSRKLGDKQTLCSSFLNYSIILRRLGKLDEAETAAYGALAIAESRQDTGSIALIYSSLCGLSLDRADFSDAARHATEGLRIWTRDASPLNLADLLVKTAMLALRADDYETAIKLTSGSERLLTASGSGNDPHSIHAREVIRSEVALSNPASVIHRWSNAGRNTTRDALILMAINLCQRHS